MAITAYTTTDIIRALLGVSSLEIEDAVVLLPNYELVFLLEVEDIDKSVGDLRAVFATCKAAQAPSPQQQRYIDLYGLLAAYSVARQLLAALDMFAPNYIGDAKAKMVRVLDQTKRLEQALNAGYNLVRSRLASAYLVFNPLGDLATPAISTYVVAVGLGSDPVLGT